MARFIRKFYKTVILTVCGLGCAIFLFLHNQHRVKFSDNKSGFDKQEQQSILNKSLSLSIDISNFTSDGKISKRMEPLKNNDNNKVINVIHVGVLGYMPYTYDHIVQFITMLYASWKYVVSHSYLKNHITTFSHLPNHSPIHIDLLIYCHPDSCKYMPKDCINWNKDTDLHSQPSCYYHMQHEYPDSDNYATYNSLIFLQDEHFLEMISHYDWLMRTDLDIFLSPAMLSYIPEKDIIVGWGGYSHPFNIERLKSIAKKLGLTHRGVHHVGSTWYGKSQMVAKVASLSLSIMRYLFAHEFDPNLPGLEGVFKTSEDGIWPKWWKPVIGMYAQELALNHLIDDFSDNYIKVFLLDTSSCSTNSVFELLHIHTWHRDCEFNKFRFMEDIGSMLHFNLFDVRLLEHSGDEFVINPQRIKPMNAQEYCTYIAWHGAANYLRQIVDLIRDKMASVLKQNASHLIQRSKWNMPEKETSVLPTTTINTLLQNEINKIDRKWEKV